MSEKLDSRAVFIHPVADRDATGSEPVRFGGLPSLPEDMEWPIDRHGCSAHFWAEINLTAIRQVAKLGTLPDFPDGTLFAFMFMYNPAPMAFLFYPGAVDGFSERPPPDTIPPLHDSDDRATGSANEPMTATEVSEFHQSVGTLAKSDNVDAKMLQRILRNAASGLVDRVWREPFGHQDSYQNPAPRETQT